METTKKKRPRKTRDRRLLEALATYIMIGRSSIYVENDLGVIPISDSNRRRLIAIKEAMQKGVRK